MVTGVDSKEAYIYESYKAQGAAELVGIWDTLAENIQRGINRA
ncbi:MAG: hypothetical protein K0Q50_714 [Vampirovibrio sp.]|jgi:hypothetical protein|nr:hypothetical protein [Vampirovibrio sp.]